MKNISINIPMILLYTVSLRRTVSAFSPSFSLRRGGIKYALPIYAEKSSQAGERCLNIFVIFDQVFKFPLLIECSNRWCRKSLTILIAWVRWYRESLKITML